MENVSMYAREARNCYFSVNCYYHRTYSDFTMAKHSHRRVEIMYVEYGELQLEYYESEGAEKQTVTLFPHDYVIIDTNVIHTIQIPSTPTRIINLEMELSPEYSPARLSLQRLMDTEDDVSQFLHCKIPVIKLSDFNNVAQLLLVLQDNLDKSDAQYRNSFIDYGLATLFVQISGDYCSQKQRLSNAHIKYARKAIQYIQNHYQSNISSADIAEYANVSQNYLNLLFKNDLGKTIMEYLHSYRISKAKTIIARSNIPYSMVYSQVGYQSKQNFNKNFLRYTGMTPREYRKQLRTKDNTHWSSRADEKTTVFD